VRQERFPSTKTTTTTTTTTTIIIQKAAYPSKKNTTKISAHEHKLDQILIIAQE
jgi:hypothetical protein